MKLRLRIYLLPGWSPLTNPDGPYTYIRERSEDSGAFQVSWAEYNGGKMPNPSLDTLAQLCKNIGEGQQLGEVLEQEAGACDYGQFASAVFRSEKASRFQVWVISDGKNFITTTHICCGKIDPQEVDEAQRIATTLMLEEVATPKPWWKIW